MKLIFNHKLLTLLIVLLAVLHARAQQSPSQATNIRISTDEKTKRLVIQYDLPSVQPSDSLYVEIETASGRRFRPNTVSGNVGKSLTPGRNKTIYWDVVRDNVQLDEEVEVIIRLVRPVSGSRPPVAAKPPTPAPVPVVTAPKKSILPIIGWVATGGLAAYTFSLSSSLNKDVEAYNKNTVAATLPEWNTAETKRKDIESRQGTFTIVAGATAALAVANVVWLVVRKSKQPRTANRGSAWLIQPDSQAIRVGFVRKF
ncbi:hypothetical protein ACFSUS_11000 [Spirosoma soli]|uniref:Protein BatD n=1 Tax=Spirosoma soli TaxID=1770529 RepID=A0ABW5M2H1_9BACT